MDHTKYDSGLKDPSVNEHLRTIVKPITSFIEEQMKLEEEKKTLRADYYELLELSLLFLGGKLKKKPGQVIFHPAGAIHHARWMAKAILKYSSFANNSKFRTMNSRDSKL